MAGVAIAVVLVAAVIHFNRPLSLDIVYTDSVQTAIKAAADDTELTVAGSPFIGTTTTPSMRPYMLEGRTFFSLERIPFDEVQEGSIVLYWDPTQSGGKVSHFVHRRNRDGSLTTKGSRNLRPDSYTVTEQEYIATVKNLFTARNKE